MRLLADESCDFAIVRALRKAGHDVAAVRDLMAGALDEEVCRYAILEDRLLLTEDKDFGQLFFSSSDRSPGVILIRFPGNARGTAAASVCDFLSVSREQARGCFTVIQPGKIRISQRPSS